MVSSSQINGDWSGIKSILNAYQSEIDGLDAGWKGPSHDSLVQQAQAFVSEYSSTIGAQMNALAYASDLYAQYKVVEKNIDITKYNYNVSIHNKDRAATSKFSSQLSVLRKELSDLKSKIESSLQKASSPKLSATSTNANSISIPVNNYNSSMEETDAGEITATPESVEEGGQTATTTASQTTSYSGGSSYASYGAGSAVAAGGAAVTSAASYAANSAGGSIAPSTGSTTSADYGELDMDNYPTGSSRADGVARAVLVAKYLVENGGFTKEQAAAMVGVYLDENNCDPGSYMAAEKSGRGAKGTGGNGYGAGIASWTFAGYKNQCLSDAGYPANTPIESLSLQQQCDMIIAMSQKSNKTYYDALKRCNTVEDAAATAFIITGGVGASSHWSTHPTQAEARALSNKYGRQNDARYGRSQYHWNLDTRRLANAKEILQYL